LNIVCLYYSAKKLNRKINLFDAIINIRYLVLENQYTSV
jgi:hypothetical protein